MIAAPRPLIRAVHSAVAVAALFAGIGLVGIPASAQDQPAGGPPAGTAPAGGRHIMAAALMTLGLTDDQKTKIRSIMADAHAKNQNADPETRHANFRAAFAKIDTVLTPDQRTRLHAKLDQLRKDNGAPPPQS